MEAFIKRLLLWVNTQEPWLQRRLQFMNALFVVNLIVFLILLIGAWNFVIQTPLLISVILISAILNGLSLFFEFKNALLTARVLVFFQILGTTLTYLCWGKPFSSNALALLVLNFMLIELLFTPKEHTIKLLGIVSVFLGLLLYILFPSKLQPPSPFFIAPATHVIIYVLVGIVGLLWYIFHYLDTKGFEQLRQQQLNYIAELQKQQATLEESIQRLQDREKALKEANDQLKAQQITIEKQQQQLQQATQELEKEKKILQQQHFIEQAIAELYDYLRWERSVKPQDWAAELLFQMQKYLDNHYASLYIRSFERQQSEYLIFLNQIGASKTDEVSLQVAFGEGLVGQAAKNQEAIHLNVEQTTVHFSLGAVQLPLHHLYVIPVVYNNQVEGVLQIGYLEEVPEVFNAFMERFLPILGAALSTIRQQMMVEQLLKASQEQTEELMAQEEELRQNLEELQATQEQLRQAQVHLQRQQGFLNALLNSLSAGVIAVDEQGNIALYNKVSLQQWGERLQRQQPLERVFEDQPQLVQFFEKALHGERFQQAWQQNGKHYELFFTPINSEKDTIQGACLLMQDVTHLKNIENALRQNERRFRYLVNNIPGIVYRIKIVGEQSSIDFISKRVVEFTHYPARAFIRGQVSLEQLWYEEDKAAIEQALQEAIEQLGDFELEHRIKTAQNTIRWVYHKGKVYQSEQIIYLDGFMLDITERKEKAKALEEMTQNLEKMVEERTAKLQRTLKELEALKEQLLASEKMAVLGSLFAGIAHEIKTPLGAIKGSVDSLQDQVPQIIKNYPKSAIDYQNDYTLLMEFIDYLLSHQRFLSSRESRKLRKSLVNYLEANGVEQADLIARRLITAGYCEAELGKFLPLFQRSEAEALSEVLFLIGQQKMHLDNIQTASVKAQKILDALKRYSHTQKSEEPVPTDVKTTIETVLILYTNQIKYNIELETHFEDVPEILAYPDELEQVWTNLIQNALHAMNNQGKLYLGLTQDDDYVIVEVRDSGHGIPPEHIDKIFEPFFTTKKKGEGTGLGLHLCKQIIEKHGGKIEVQSKPGDTRFFVYLPKKK